MPEVILSAGRLRLEKIGVEYKNDLFGLLTNPKVHRYFPKALDDRERDEFNEKIQVGYKRTGSAAGLLSGQVSYG